MVRRMLRKVSVIALCVLALGLEGCALGLRSKGSTAIARFLAAAQGDGGASFEASLDRPALRSDLREQLAALGRSHGVDVGGPSEFALDRMITPMAVRQAAARVAPGWPATPTAQQIVPHMKVVEGGKRVCLEEAATKRCLLTFARRDDKWRLIGLAFTPPAAAP